MNNKELVSAIAAETGLYKKDISVMVSAYRDVVAKALASGDSISLYSYMTMEPIDVPQRNVRNPKSGEYGLSDAHKRIKIHFTKKFLDDVNNR